MVRRLRQIVYILAVIIVLAACRETAVPVDVELTPTAVAVMQTPTPIATASATLAPISTQPATTTPTPLITPTTASTPTITPTPSPTSAIWVRSGAPLPSTSETITAENATQVTELARWGRGVISDIALSADGEWVAIAAGSGVYVHNVYDLNAPPRTIETTGNVTAVAISNRGDKVALYLRHGQLQLWQIEPVTLLYTQDARISQIQFSPDGSVLAIARHLSQTVGVRIELLDSLTGTIVASFPTRYYARFSFSPDGAQIATVWQGSDSGIVVYDWQAVNEFFTIEAVQHPSSDEEDKQLVISDIVFVNEEDIRLLVHEIRDYTFSTGRIEVQEAMRSSETAQLLFSASRNVNLSGATKYVCNEPVIYWSAPEPTTPQRMEISADNQIAAILYVDPGYTGDYNQYSSLRFYRVADGRLLYAVEEKLVNFALLPDGETWIAGLQDGRLQRRRLNDGAVLESVNAYESPIVNIDLSSDSEWVGVAHLDEVKIHSLTDNDLRYRYPAVEVAFAPDGLRFALGYADGRIELRHISDGALLTTVAAHEELITSLRFLPSGDLLSAGLDCKLILWQAPEITSLGSLENIMVEGEYSGEQVPWRVRRFLLMPGGEVVIGLLFGGDFGLWSLSDYRLIRSPDWESRANILAVSPDSAYVAVREHSAFLSWDSPQPIGARGNIASFSPDSALLVAGLAGSMQDSSLNGALQLWTVPGATWLHDLTPRTAGVMAVLFNGDGRIIISGALDGVVRLWGLPES
jgi:WD40 repeat protein